jgi:signal transduction histidine kinase
MAEIPAVLDNGNEPDGGAGLWRGLSGKLLVLTIVFVLIAEVLIFVPSVANFRNVWLQGHLDTAEAASIVYLDSSDPMLSDRAQRELLAATGSLAVVIREGAMSRLMASSEMPGIDRHYDLTTVRPMEAVASAFAMLFATREGHYRVFAPMKSRDAVIELVQSDLRLQQAIRVYSRNVALLSLAISMITAALVFLALYRMIVRPVRRISGNMTAFAREPDNAALILQPSQRTDEIGVAERRLAAFEADLHRTLRQRQHLADLGLAVAKINHDMRNILASAQLFTDRLADVDDPVVQRLAPKLLRTINRAAGYSQAVLAYGRAAEEAPRRRALSLHALADEVAELLGLAWRDDVEWINEVPADLEIEADPEQLLRALMNLCRNALQAMERHVAETPAALQRLRVSACIEGADVHLRVADTGPGIGEKLGDEGRAALFRPFQATSKQDGAGLGLAIAAELVRAHGGAIEVERSSPAGTVFLLKLPRR